MGDGISIFDRHAVRRHRDRAAATDAGGRQLLSETAARLADRLSDVTRRFPVALDLGCRTGVMARCLGDRGGIETLIQCDLSQAMAAAARPQDGPRLVADEEFLPFGPNSLDLVMSCLSLHWVNDLPGALIQIRHALRPDGLFLAAMLGGETLSELREALMEAEIGLRDGASPRVSPFADVRELGGLLQRAGFALPVTDVDTIVLGYENAFALMHDLRAMAETNAVQARSRHWSSRELLMRAAAEYQSRHARPDGSIRATFQVIYLTGWAPDDTQQQPLRPGSAQARLADALSTTKGSISCTWWPKATVFWHATLSS